ncbi:MAG: virulence RhuM family protein [Lachnospiraceae bacterium]|nr:virulence RhuM family protein [Candidatus Hippenecus merdae]
MMDRNLSNEERGGDIIIYQSETGDARIDVRFEDETVWLSLDQMAALFQRDKSTISRHIKNVFRDGELKREATVANFATVQTEGGRSVEREIEHYNLDVIISVGYRVKSQRGVQFRLWATNVLKEYMKKGFALDDERLKNLGGGNYWKELLNRIRDIRSSEKVLYRQVLDLYATAVDYDPKSDASVMFFRIVQNKLHYAAHGHTAAEVVFQRADADQPFMGLKSFDGEMPTLKDIGIAKNYLSEEELKVLNNLVSGYFDIAEINAIEHRPMYMDDYIKQLDAVLTSGNRKLLGGAGSVSHAQAMEKATAEYRKYQVENLSPVEKEYLEVIKKTAKIARRKSGSA